MNEWWLPGGWQETLRLQHWQGVNAAVIFLDKSELHERQHAELIKEIRAHGEKLSNKWDIQDDLDYEMLKEKMLELFFS